jgi:pimeloyl-ACP methyl ester carboxylesterase
MELLVGDLPVSYAERGDGLPVLVLHGAGVDHREVLACLEPAFRSAPGYRRLYPDLPGMGRTPAPESVSSADDVLDVLLGFVDGVVGDAPVLVAGHSAGAYFARAIAARRPTQVAGLMLLCPLLPGSPDVPGRDVVFGPGDLGDAEFRDYFTVRTPEMLERYEAYVAPGAQLADQVALSRIGECWDLTPRPGDATQLDCPTLVVAGRQDTTVGYAAAVALLADCPRATLAVLDRAGHALPHEQPDLLTALVVEWLDRVREHVAG